jgi:rhodanese-related sulfurtransferase
MKRVAPLELAADPRRRIDVREFPEFAAGAVPQSLWVALSSVTEAARTWDRQEPLVLICRSGKRATQAAEKLGAMGFRDVAILDGGMEAWGAAGLPCTVAARPPMSLERQVRVIAGAMVLISAALGLLLSPWFFLWTVLVGGGLFFAGLTDVCLLATWLGKLPWNRPSIGPACPGK